jgi:hypothetical protein
MSSVVLLHRQLDDLRARRPVAKRVEVPDDQVGLPAERQQRRDAVVRGDEISRLVQQTRRKIPGADDRADVFHGQFSFPGQGDRSVFGKSIRTAFAAWCG